jgi:hypothetical protein
MSPQLAVKVGSERGSGWERFRPTWRFLAVSWRLPGGYLSVTCRLAGGCVLLALARIVHVRF